MGVEPHLALEHEEDLGIEPPGREQDMAGHGMEQLAVRRARGEIRFADAVKQFERAQFLRVDRVRAGRFRLRPGYSLPKCLFDGEIEIDVRELDDLDAFHGDASAWRKRRFCHQFPCAFPARYIINIGEDAGFASVRLLAAGILLEY